MCVYLCVFICVCSCVPLFQDFELCSIARDSREPEVPKSPPPHPYPLIHRNSPPNQNEVLQASATVVRINGQVGALLGGFANAAARAKLLGNGLPRSLA